MPRSQLIAVLVVMEVAILGGMVIAVRGGQPAPSFAQIVEAAAAPGQRLVEGGPHRQFDAGAHPSLTVDIGYADLTILTRSGSPIDVSVSKSTAFGLFRTKSPITARKDGETIRIATTDRHEWTMGDDRMVTVVVSPETQVTVVNAGDIKASGLRSEALFNCVGHGSVTVEDFAAPRLRLSASNGRISLHRIVTAHLKATSRNGRVEGTGLQVRDGSIESSNGRVTLGFATGADTLVTAKTSNGAIRVSGFAPAAVTGTRKSSDDEDDDDDSSTQTVRVGAGDGRLDVESSNGNISLRQPG